MNLYILSVFYSLLMKIHPIWLFYFDLQAQLKYSTDVLANLNMSTDVLTAVKSSDLVIEAIVENLDVKRELFGLLDNAAPEWVFFLT